MKLVRIVYKSSMHLDTADFTGCNAMKLYENSDVAKRLQINRPYYCLSAASIKPFNNVSVQNEKIG